jgi:lambda repressor-like predicted transcriptional regulator
MAKLRKGGATKVSGWPPQKIKAALVLRGITQTRLARKIGVSASMVGNVIRDGKVSRRVREAIAKELKAKVTDIWPAA